MWITLTGLLSFMLSLALPMLASAAVAAQSSGLPVFLSAAELGYDRKQAIVVALGKVEIIQGEIIVLADRLTYNQNTNEVTASGNVSMRQPNGDVLFADYVELQDDLSRGVVQNFRARLSDDSLFTAREARRINENLLEMDEAVYSPCKLCEGFKNPLWQLRAGKVELDQIEEKVFYEDAQLEVYGVPVAYLPYFSHVTPDARAKSGILSPEAGADSELGVFAKVPVYINLAENSDITLSPMLLSKEAPILFGEYRHLFENGEMQWRGSLTNPEKRDDLGNRADGREFRGHIDAVGNFGINDEWNWGFELQRSTDDTYLRRYDINTTDTLTSRLFVQGIKNRRFISLQGLAFQGLTPEDNNDTTPYVLPLGDFEWEGEPGWMNSRFSAKAGSMVLSRRVGALSRRLSMTGAWELPYITDGGHVFTSRASIRGDVYDVEDVTRTANNTLYDGSPARVIPQLELGWKYPLINAYAPNRSFMIEPIIQYVVSPGGSNTNKIPNEDSLIPEFNDANLFEANRFAGYDRVETGSRFNAGVQGLWQFADTKQFDFLFGQHYRTDQDNPFPFSNDLTEELSDYVGRVGIHWDTNFTAAYRFRLDRNNLNPQRNEVNASLNLSPVTLRVDYLGLNNDPFLADRQEVVANGSVKVTDYWTLFAGTRRDLKENEQIAANAGFRYLDECFGLYGNFSRSLIRDRDVEPNTSFILRVELENLN